MAKKRGTTQAQGKLDAKLLAYCAMASGALLAAPPAEAAVVYSGVKNLPVSTSNTQVSVDLDNDTINDMQFLGSGYHHGMVGGYVNVRSQMNLMPLNNNDAVPFISAGVSIVPDLPWSPNGNTLDFAHAYGFRSAGVPHCFQAIGGPFVSAVPTYWGEGVEGSKTGYIGVKFTIGDRKHYGWIQYHGEARAVSVAVGGSYRYCYPEASASGTIIDWAYESTADTPIKAGQTTGTGTDTDGDGIYDSGDNCPAVANPQQLDADNDTIGDVCDPAPGCGGCGQAACEYVDTDADGIQNYVDNCPAVANPQQKDADSDGIGDVCDTTPGCGGGCGQPVCEGEVDTDHDYVRDAIDNCPSVFNPNQLDANGNGTGDCCDTTPGCGGEGQTACDTFCSL